jgi:hypothetical protein
MRLLDLAGGKQALSSSDNVDRAAHVQHAGAEHGFLIEINKLNRFWRSGQYGRRCEQARSGIYEFSIPDSNGGGFCLHLVRTEHGRPP